jgi:transposase-like protein
MLGQKGKNYNIYPKQLSIRVAEEVVSGIKRSTEVSRDYDIPVVTVKRWVKKYRNLILSKETKEFLPLDSMKKKKENVETDLEKKIKEQEEEIMRLRNDLHQTNLKAELLDKMIDIAERTYGIGVRKNSGAKQSKK